MDGWEPASISNRRVGGSTADWNSSAGVVRLIPHIHPHRPLPRKFSHRHGRPQYISITPESEFHYWHTHPHSHLIQGQASLGIDTHFTFSSDILTQTRIWLQSTRQRLYSEILGRWEVPGTNPMSVGDVEAVLVDGKWKKKDGKLMGVEGGYAQFQGRFLASARRIQNKLIETPSVFPREGEERPASELLVEDPLTVDTLRREGRGMGMGRCFWLLMGHSSSVVRGRS